MFRIQEYTKGWVVEVQKQKWYGKKYWTHFVSVAGIESEPWYYSTLDFAMIGFQGELKNYIKIRRKPHLQKPTVVLPSKEDILKEAEKQISDWLENSTEREKKHYRVAFRRSFEYIIRVTKK